MARSQKSSQKAPGGGQNTQQGSEGDGSWTDWFVFIVAWGFIRTILVCPYPMRLRMMGFFVRWIAGPLAGYRDRAEANLSHIWPDMPADERRAIANRVLQNSGRALIENFDLKEQKRRSAAAHVYGPGLAAIDQAQAENQPVLLISGHFGNYTANRSAMAVRGYEVAALYRPWSNAYLNRHYMAHFGTGLGPAFPQGRRGTMGLVRHLNGGGIGAIMFDVYDSAGVKIDFMGKPAPTLTSAADIALKTGSLLIPCFATRAPNGVDYQVCYEEPVAHGDPAEMMREVTRRLEARVNAHPDQWFWVHRRWKPDRQERRQRKAAAANMGPKSGA